MLHPAAKHFFVRSNAQRVKANARGYCPQAPTVKQQEFLDSKELEVFFGGAAGGGKSSAMLMAALQYVHVPGYAALIVRRTFGALSQPGALMDRANTWLAPTNAKWNSQTHRWSFPNGASLTFGYFDHEKHKDQYQGGEFDFIGVEEVTQFPINWYRYLFSRLRRVLTKDVPPRMRSTGNPGGIGHIWVKERFIDPATRTARFIPSKLTDNPHLSAEEYRASLAELDEVTRKQLEDGDWDSVITDLVYSPPRLTHIQPPRFEVYVLGLDFGAQNDECTYSVLGYNHASPVVTVVQSYKRNHSPSESGDEATKLNEQFKFRFMVGDENGLGKAYAKEIRRRFNLPVEPADKQNKAGYIKLFNGATERGEILVYEPECRDLIKEMKRLPWKDASREEVSEGFDDDCCDSTLYAWRRCQAFRAKHHRVAPGGIRGSYTS